MKVQLNQNVCPPDCGFSFVQVLVFSFLNRQDIVILLDVTTINVDNNR